MAGMRASLLLLRCNIAPAVRRRRSLVRRTIVGNRRDCRSFSLFTPASTSAFSTSSTATTNSVAEVQLLLETAPDPQKFAGAIRTHHDSQTPVILRGAARYFPAIQKWQDMHHYLKERIDPEMEFDIEIGGYNQGGEKVCITFEQYLMYLNLATEREDETIPNDQLLYLAQNDLPAQLEDDIDIPAVCTDASLGVGSGRLYQRNLWMGPAQCFSPLHFDPLDNFLMQIVGRKRVYLIDKQVDESLLYTGKTFGQQPNTSAVNVENPDYEQHPRFREAASEMLVTELRPGDILFIPQKWWHAARSLDLSISVNVWWR